MSGLSSLCRTETKAGVEKASLRKYKRHFERVAVAVRRPTCGMVNEGDEIRRRRSHEMKERGERD